MGVLSSLRKWWDWRAAQGRIYISGIAEYTTVGTVVALIDGKWSIEDDNGRLIYVPVNNYTSVADVRIGDRVEIQPIPQGGPVLRPHNWTILRKLEAPLPDNSQYWR
jgi:hypothetical protein